MINIYIYIYIYIILYYIILYIYIYIYIISHKYFELFSCFKRLCKTTKIFVTNKNAFFI